jgi:hypothetical protein
MAKKATRPGARKNVFKATFTRFANKRGSRGRARFADWRKILMHDSRRDPKHRIRSRSPFLLSTGSARPRCAPAPPGLKSVSPHRTKRLQRYFALRLPKPLGGAPPIS